MIYYLLVVYRGSGSRVGGEEKDVDIAPPHIPNMNLITQ